MTASWIIDTSHAVVPQTVIRLRNLTIGSVQLFHGKGALRRLPRRTELHR
jgi:hypothetical protein